MIQKSNKPQLMVRFGFASGLVALLLVLGLVLYAISVATVDPALIPVTGSNLTQESVFEATPWLPIIMLALGVGLMLLGLTLNRKH